MSARAKVAAALGAIGIAAVAANAFAATAAGAPAPPELRAQAEEANLVHAKRGNRCGRPHRPARRRPVVHAETIVAVEKGFATIVVDHGSVTAVDPTDGAVTIRRVDGVSVTATVGSETRVCADGKRATLADVEAGDSARLVQVTREGATTVRALFAHDPDAAPAARPSDRKPRMRRGAGPAIAPFDLDEHPVG